MTDEHCDYCCYGSDLGWEIPLYHDLIAHHHPDCPIHGHLAMDFPGA